MDQSKKNDSKIISDYFYAEEGDSLELILVEKLKVPDEVLFGKDYLRKIILWNPGLSNINSLKEGERVYIELPYGEYGLQLISRPASESKIVQETGNSYKELFEDTHFNIGMNLKQWQYSEAFTDGSQRASEEFSAIVLGTAGEITSEVNQTTMDKYANYLFTGDKLKHFSLRVGVEFQIGLFTLSDDLDTQVKILDTKFYLQENFSYLDSSYIFSIKLGGHFMKMFVSDESFGYDYTVAPYLGFGVKRSFLQKHTLGAELEWSSLVNTTLPDFREKDILFRLSHSYAYKNSHVFVAQVAYSNLFYRPKPNAEITASAFYLSLFTRIDY